MYEVRQAKDKDGNPIDLWYFVLLGANGQVLSTSETYVSKFNAERGVVDAQLAAMKAIDPEDAA